MSFFVLLAIQVALFALGKLLQPRVKRPKAPNLEFPRADEGVPIPIGYGRFAVAPNIVWCGDFTISGPANDDDVFHFYLANMVGTLCLGEVSDVLDIQFGGKSLRFEPQTNKQGGTVCFPQLPLTADDSVLVSEFTIHAQQMFGGLTQEGGVDGTIRFYYGRLNQTADPITDAYMQAAGISAGTARPGVCYAVFDKTVGSDLATSAFYWGTVPQPKDLVFILKHSPDALGVGMPDHDDANPAEIIYDLLTSNTRGMGLSTDLVDTDNFTAVAETLLAEGLGLSPCFSDQDEVEDMIDDILKHIIGVLRISPVTGKYELKLARADYLPEDVPRITTTLRGGSYANAKNLKVSRPNYRETTNDIQITYRRFATSVLGGVVGRVLTTSLDYISGGIVVLDTHAQNITLVTLYDDGVIITSGYTFNTATGTVLLSTNSGAEEGSVITIDFTAGPVFNGYKEATVQWQNLASVQQSGELRSQTFDYPFFTTDLNAARHVARLGQQLGRELLQARWDMDRTGFDIAPGDVRRINHQPLDEAGNEFTILDDEPFRITEVDYGRLEDGIIGVSAVEDVWADDVRAIPLPGAGAPGEGLTLVAPAVGISQAATSAIRILFAVSDTNFYIELHRATDEAGTGETTLSSTIVGTTTEYDDPQTIGAVLYYRARLTPTSSQIGYIPGPWTPWVEMTAASGTPADYVCTVPTWIEEPSDTGAIATVTVTTTDPQSRVLLVEFRYALAGGAFGVWAQGSDQIQESGVDVEESEGEVVDPQTNPYSISVAYTTTVIIERRITYIGCPSGVLTSTASFSFPQTSDSVIDGGEFVYEGTDLVVVR